MGLMNTMMAGRPEPVNDMEAGQAVDAAAPEATSVPPELAAEIVRALANPKVKEAVIEAGQSEDPAAALTGLAYGMIEGLDEKTKGQIPPQAMPDIAMEIVETLSDLVGGDDSLKAQVLKMLVEQSTKQTTQFLSGRGGSSQPQQPQSMPAPMPQGVQ